jgi:hypothetical protein
MGMNWHSMSMRVRANAVCGVRHAWSRGKRPSEE